MFNGDNKQKWGNPSFCRQYANENASPFAKAVVKVIVMLVTISIVFVVCWNVFSMLIPVGSWINIVDGDSMYPTMHNRQIIFTDMSDVERGDVITLQAPAAAVQANEQYLGTVWVKRVIGVPGDTILIDQTGLYVNETKINEEYLTEEAKWYTYKEDNQFNSMQLSEDEYYVIGDNRNNSYDSRKFGAIKQTDILYKQNARPTANFYVKLLFAVLIFMFNLLLYAIVELVLTECIYQIAYGRKAKEQNNKVNKSEAPAELNGAEKGD